MARKRRGGLRARAPPKSQERALVERAKAVIDDFSPLLPECTPSCKSSTFLKVERALSRVQKFAGNQQRLEKLALRGDMIARAYAGLLLIAESGRVPYTAAAPTPFGEAIYAVRGKVDSKVMLGIQNYNDKRLLLLAYMPYALKKGLYLYATKEHLYCTGKNPHPPEEYVKEALARIPYSLKRNGSSLTCKHLNDSSSVPYIRIAWQSADLEISVCEKCLSDDVNIFAKLTESMGSKNPLDDFEIDAVVELEALSDPKNCPRFEKRGIKKIRDAYIHGKLSDKAFMERSKSSGEYGKDGRYLIIGRKCYGEDERAFVDALNPKDRHRQVVEEFVRKRKGPIILESPSVNKLLAYSWDEWGEDALESYMKSTSLAKSVWEAGMNMLDNPLAAIDNAIEHMEADLKLSRLPSYGELPPAANFCDTVAREYRVGGRDAAIHAIDEREGKNEHIKALGYAFLTALGSQKGKEWRYTRTERELGEFLAPRAKKLLEYEGEDYHRALLELLKYAGVNEKVVKR